MKLEPYLNDGFIGLTLKNLRSLVMIRKMWLSTHLLHFAKCFTSSMLWNALFCVFYSEATNDFCGYSGDNNVSIRCHALFRHI